MDRIYIILEERDCSFAYSRDIVKVPVCWVPSIEEADKKVSELTEQYEQERANLYPSTRPKLSWYWEEIPKG